MRIPLAAGRVPLVGHAPALRRDPLGFMRRLREQGEISRIAIGPRRILVVNSPELVRRVLVLDARSFDKGALFDQARAHLGNGLVTSSGEFHRRQRRLAQPAFHSGRIARYAELMAEVVEERTRQWRPHEPLELHREISALTLDVLLRCLFSSQNATEVREVLTRSLSAKQGSMKRALSPWAAWRDLVSGRRITRTGRQELHAVLARQVAHRRRRPDEQDDLLSMLLAADMTDEQLCDELVTLFVAGTETVSAALAWTFHELARHPHVEERLLGDGPEYTRRVCQEVLRRYAVWLLMRRTVTPTTLAGHQLKPGTEVFFGPNALHHDPALYPDPDTFDPDRWLTNIPPKGAYLPFGAGNRLCLGEGFAWTEMAVVLRTITARWRLVPVPGHKVRTRVGTLLEPDRLPMTPVPR